MGKHFAAVELDNMQKWKSESLTPVQIHARLVRDRARRKQYGPDLTTVRRFLKGKSHKRSTVELRGRKRSLSDANLHAMNRVRKQLVQKADGEREVTWTEVISKSRVPGVDRSTAAKHMKEKFDVKARPPRLKPARSKIDGADRKDKCNSLRKRSPEYWLDGVHLYMDNTPRVPVGLNTPARARHTAPGGQGMLQPQGDGGRSTFPCARCSDPFPRRAGGGARAEHMHPRARQM